MANAHVVPSGVMWHVKVDSQVLYQKYTQDAAWDAARLYLQDHGGGELWIHGQDGQVRAKDTIYPGNDPRNVRG